MPTRATNAADAFLSLNDAALLDQCDMDRYRARGPGGQKRNKTSSAVRLRHHPTGVAVTAVESRSQHENKARALRRLRMAIALQVRTPVDLDVYAPSDLLTDCKLAGRGLSLGRRDARYPAVVCELLDLCAAHEGGVRATAAGLGITTAGLVKFCRAEPKLWKCVNELRARFHRKPLR